MIAGVDTDSALNYGHLGASILSDELKLLFVIVLIGPNHGTSAISCFRVDFIADDLVADAARLNAKDDTLGSLQLAAT